MQHMSIIVKNVYNVDSQSFVVISYIFVFNRRMEPFESLLYCNAFRKYILDIGTFKFAGSFKFCDNDILCHSKYTKRFNI